MSGAAVNLFVRMAFLVQFLLPAQSSGIIS